MISYVLQYIGILLGYSIVMTLIVRCIRIVMLKFLYKKNYMSSIKYL